MPGSLGVMGVFQVTVTRMSVMHIHQLSVTYLGEQDRILVRISTTESSQVRLWLTRRLTLGMRPLLNAIQTQQLVQTEAAVTSQTDSRLSVDADMKQMLADFRKQELLQNADFDTPFADQGTALPLGEEPLLITEASVSPRGSAVHLELAEKLPGVEKPRSLKLELEPKLMQGLLVLLDKALAHSEWAQPAMETVAPSLTDLVDAEKPRYLN